YHVLNIVLHILCAVLAFGVIRRTLELPRLRLYFQERSAPVAFAAVLLWTVHQLNTEVVDYLTQRSESMMAAIFLLTLYAAKHSLSDSRSAAWQGLAVTSCALGVLCKESMATAPLIVVLYDRAFVFDSWSDQFRKRGTFYAALAASWVVLGIVVLT